MVIINCPKCGKDYPMTKDNGHIYCPKCGFMVPIDWVKDVAERLMKLGPKKFNTAKIIAEEEIGRLSEDPDAKVWLQDCGLKITMPVRFGWDETTANGDLIKHYSTIDEFYSCTNPKKIIDFDGYDRAHKEFLEENLDKI